jgi:tetratricopeptide (TPR) repeat protein
MDRTPTPDVAAFQYWSRVRLGGDSVKLREFRAGLDTMSAFHKTTMALYAQIGVGTIDDAQQAVESALRHAATPEEKDEAFLAAHRLYMNMGRLDDADRILDQATPNAPLLWYPRAIKAALFWDGDTVRARVSADSISRNLARTATGSESATLRSAACLLGQWQLRQRTKTDYDRILGLLQSISDTNVPRPQDQLCVALLRATRSAAFNEPDAPILLERLDSMAAVGYGGWVPLRDANATIAQLRDARGQTELAARAQQRFTVNVDSHEYLSTWKRERGRFALAQGDTASAISHWSDYLRLQAKAEGTARSRMEQVRAQLGALTGEPRR